MFFFEQNEEEKDTFFMRRCIQLAQNGGHTTPPNPMVGAVIVHEGKIIGEGYHIRPGEAHAEVNAIHAVKDESLLPDSTLYVSLEPCAHYGKTPPCADLIIQKRIPRVRIGCKDPFSKVNGNGIQKLENAGVEVKVGILEKECIALNRKFITFHSKKRPYIILKWAESADGFIDLKRKNGSPYIFSTPHTAMFAHKLRSENESILIGRRTAVLDNPSLTVRNWIGPNPTRIIIDKEKSLYSKLHIFDQSVLTILFNSEEQKEHKNIFFVKIDWKKNILPQIADILYKQGIQSLLIEGGSYTLQSFIDMDLWDEAYIERSSVCLKNGIQSPSISGIKESDIYFGVPYTHCLNPNSGFTSIHF